ncbi:unnamed protein product [Calicophoron daubneyi]|uniref:TIR domain-containing protein n=1 Tax=Calicophoron daubneyi TaxID=300641 RepID=A0AAV2TL03_CALDB
MYSEIRDRGLRLQDRREFLEACVKATDDVVHRLITFASTKSYRDSLFPQLVEAFLRSYYAIEKPVSYAEEYRIRVCDDILSKSSVSSLLGAIYCDLTSLEMEHEFKFTESEHNEEILTALVNLQTALANYLDCSPKLAMELVSCNEYMEMVRTLLTKSLRTILNNRGSKELRLLVRYTISGVYNALRHEDEKVMQQVIHLDMVDLVRAYTSCEDSKIQMASYMFLAYTVTEKSKLNLTETKAIGTFIQSLNEATKSQYGRGRGYTELELLKGIRILAQNDENKRALVQQGILPCLREILNSHKPDHEEEVLLILWTLSFDPENKAEIKEEFEEEMLNMETRMTVNTGYQVAKKVIEEEKAVTTTTPLEAASTASADVLLSGPGIGFEAEKEKSWEARKRTGALKALKGLIWQLGTAEEKPLLERSSSAELSIGGHVMLSYQHQNKAIATQIAQRLKEANLKVWIDLDSMSSESDIMEGMASAIENAFVICIIYSKAYKDSPNTRSEAQYAYRMKKPILFLRAQPGYQPDGWLGIMIGTRLYIDFSGKYPFEQKFEELLHSIEKLSAKGPDTLDSIQTEKSIEAVTSTTEVNKTPDHSGPNDSKPSTTPESRPYASWDEKATRKWLRESKAVWNGKEALTGRHLVFLRDLESQAPAFFFDTLKTNGHLTDLNSLMNFVNAIKNLPS